MIAKEKITLPTKIRVVLADDHHVVRSGIRSELEQHNDIEVIGEAANGEEAIILVEQLRPDVLLLDINMPGMPGTIVTEQLNKLPNIEPQNKDVVWPPHVLILSAYCEPEYVYNLFAAGAKGYLLKDEPPEYIASGIRQVMRGEPSLSLSVQKVLLTRKIKPEHDLTIRELDVLRLIAKGNTNEEIAHTLIIAVGTVKNHVMNIYRKLPNVRTRSEAVAWAWENRVVELE
ncbi:MAG: response regulator transcription factor [Chloroflexi bacterium]|nr:response regulator transcription factor [Chloroflexota bacterium]